MNREDIESIFTNQEMIRAAEKEEPRFLNILLKDKDKLANAVASGIIPVIKNNPGHFIISKNNFIYSLILKYYQKYHNLLTRSAIDSIVDMQEVGSEAEKSSIKTYWDEIWRRPDAAVEDFDMLKDKLNERYVFWQWVEAYRGGNKIIASNNGYLESIKNFQKAIANINSVNADSYSKTMDLCEGVDKAIEYIDKRRNNPNAVDTIFSGIQAIDSIFNGWERGSYIVVSGMINGGKTTLMFNLGYNMAKLGYNVAYVSLEKKADLFFRRILCLHAGVDYNRLKRGGNTESGISDFWYGKLMSAAKDLKENIKPHYTCLQYVQQTRLSKILSELDRMRSTQKIDVVFVDYLQVIGVETSHPTRPDLDLAEVHRRLMAYGREHNILVFTALQLKNQSAKDIRKSSKKVMNDVDADKVEVNPEDFSGSQLVVADADNALGVVLNSDHPPTKMIVNISKARDDESKKSLILDFDGKVGRISDPSLDPNRISHTDQLLYAEDLDENKLKKDDLFDSNLPPPSFDPNEEPEKIESNNVSSTTTMTTTFLKEEKKPETKNDDQNNKSGSELDTIELESDDQDDEGMWKI